MSEVSLLGLNCSFCHLACQRNLKFNVSRMKMQALIGVPNHSQSWIHLLNYLNDLLNISFLQMHYFSSITLTDPGQPSAIPSLPWQSHTPGLPPSFPSPRCCRALVLERSSGHLPPPLCSIPITVALFSELSHVPHLAHRVTAISLTFSQKMRLFPSPVTHSKPYCLYDFLCLDVFPALIT